MHHARGRAGITAAVAALAGSLACAGASPAATPTATLFGEGQPELSGPSGIAPGWDGNLWSVMQGNNTVARITPAGAITFFTKGTDTSARLVGTTTGPDGNQWFTDSSYKKVGRIDPATGAITQFTVTGAGPDGITAGPDGNLWFTEGGSDQIGRITPTGTITQFPLPAGARPNDIATGPDGNLWFTERGSDQIGRITPTGTITHFGIGITPGSDPAQITAGPDGRMWFTEETGRVGRVDPATGVIVEFAAGLPANTLPFGITAGPDGNLWFADLLGDALGTIDPSTGTITEFTGGMPAQTRPRDITPGPDGNLWFSGYLNGTLGRMTTGVNPPAFTNATRLAVPGGGTSGPANLYPSPITVSGREGTVTDVRVRLNGLFHTAQPDLEFLLVGPQGQKVTLLADPGPATGTTASYGSVITLTDDGLTPPDLLVSGRFTPRVYAAAPTFPAPAPTGPYATTLSAFDGTSPNGQWLLYANDDAATGTGALVGGWSLDVDTQAPAPPPAPPASGEPAPAPVPSGTTAGPGPTAAVPDTTKPTLKLTKLTARPKLAAFRKAVTFTLTPSEAVTVRATLSFRKQAKVGKRTKTTVVVLATAKLPLKAAARKLTLKPSSRKLGTPIKPLRTTLAIVATDAAGNKRTLTRSVTVLPAAKRRG